MDGGRGVTAEMEHDLIVGDVVGNRGCGGLVDLFFSLEMDG
jgi:hypothetical protein